MSPHCKMSMPINLGITPTYYPDSSDSGRRPPGPGRQLSRQFGLSGGHVYANLSWSPIRWPMRPYGSMRVACSLQLAPSWIVLRDVNS
jgi:hypothetical protein